jgi:hypothetical protein
MKTLKTCIATAFLTISSLGTAFADEWGYIVKDHYSGWVLAEAYPPYASLKEGAYIKGNLNGYGFEYVLVYRNENDTSPTKAKIYIDNYMMSEEDASHYCFTGEDM